MPDFDLAAYERYLSGNIVDYDYPDDKIADALTRLPQVNL